MRAPLLRPASFAIIAILYASSPVFSHGDDSERAGPVVPEGSELAGKTLFVDKGCYQCHNAGEIRMPAGEFTDLLVIELGTRDHAAWTRDDYARAIMNPDHTISPDYRKVMTILGERLKAESSPMPAYADLLTVSDLIHLSTFLETLKRP